MGDIPSGRAHQGAVIRENRHGKAWRRPVFTLFLLLLLVAGPAFPALALIPELSASVDNPTPNPVPAGSTATTTAQFFLSADTAPLTVGIQLLGPGFGSLRLDGANTTSGLINCVETATEVSCDWDGQSSGSPQTLAIFIDVDGTAAPGSNATLAAVAGSATEPTATYATADVYADIPVGTTTLSGVVITDGGAPVAEACLFILSSPSYVFPTLTDGNGEWMLTGLPDTYSFVVAAVPPFDVGFGPCASNGPPPVPGPGELQPVFYDDIWIDLSDPNLTGGLMDPYDFAVAAGATILDTSVSGLVSCLTTAPGDVVPRPPCIPLTTTATSAATTTTVDIGGTDATTTTLPDELPFTGIESGILLVAGPLFLLLGLIALSARRSEDDTA